MSMSRITHIVVHYAWTPINQSYTAADIDRMHRDRGWRMIGYHEYIRRDGMVEMGRPVDQVGAHVGGQNSGKIGICYEGGRLPGDNTNGHDTRTEAQTKALIERIRHHLKKHPKAKVVGHWDLAATKCPGFDVPAWWARVEKKKAPAPKAPDPSAPAKTPGVGEDEAHTVERGETLWGIAREHGLSVAQITEWNGLASDRINPGDALYLAPPSEAPQKPAQPHPDTKHDPKLIALVVAVVTTVAALAAFFGLN